jgi:hypothetical protein
MAIKNQSFLAELQPYAKMTVVPGVTVGDLNFASAQSSFSTGYIAPSAPNTFDSNRSVDLFQSAIGDSGQGLAPGQVMTRSQTNWINSAGRLPANEVFIGIRCGYSLYKHRNSDKAITSGASFAATAGVFSSQLLFPSVAALWQLVHAFSWEYQIGDGIIRNSGALSGYPAAGGVYEPPAPALAGNALAVQNGYPCPSVGVELPIPFMFLPNITSRITVRSGSKILLEDVLGAGVTIDDGSDDFSEFLAVRCTLQGYKLTMPV